MSDSRKGATVAAADNDVASVEEEEVKEEETGSTSNSAANNHKDKDYDPRKTLEGVPRKQSLEKADDQGEHMRKVMKREQRKHMDYLMEQLHGRMSKSMRGKRSNSCDMILAQADF